MRNSVFLFAVVWASPGLAASETFNLVAAKRPHVTQWGDHSIVISTPDVRPGYHVVYFSTNLHTWTLLGTGDATPDGHETYVVSSPISADRGSRFYKAQWFGPRLKFLAQPKSQAVTLGAPLRLEADAIGPEPITYEWRRDGVAIPGATNKVFEIKSATKADGGAFQVFLQCPHLPRGRLPTSPVVDLMSEKAFITVQP